MTTGNNTASFFENGTTEQFEYCFQLYPKVLQIKAEKRCKKPQDLIRLDQWYQNELPRLIKGRGKDAHLLYDELVQTMKWKQSRGKFYPQLSYLVKVNTPRAVMQETKKAFRKLPNLEQAITALSNLKGVGTTMASALLAAASPDSAPFMADECLMAIPEIEGIDYTTKEYLNFVQHIQSTVERLNAQVVGAEKPIWSPHRVELALWAHYVANDLSPEMLEEMPGPGSGGGANATNGSKSDDVSKVLDGGDDTNDVDDESLGAAGRIISNLTTESETENENTNSMPITNTVGVLQDGDSNFVSNDSTSQEPIIDENTTQTTATTSTDDGEAGTPLVSDSESNIEAPIKANTIVQASATAATTAQTTTTTTAATGTVTATNKTELNDKKTDENAVVGAPLLSISNCSSSSGSGSGNSNSNSSCNNSNSSIGKNMNNVNNSNSNNNNNSSSNSKLAANTHLVGNGKDNGNGNGTLLVLGGRAAGGGGGGGGDSLDGENSNCLRSSANELYTDEEDRNVDESSNSNSRGGHKSITPIINMHDGNTNTNSTTNTDNDSTLSSAAGLAAIGQKRTLHCAVDAVGAVADSLDVPLATAAAADIGNQPPEAKKIRSD